MTTADWKAIQSSKVTHDEGLDEGRVEVHSSSARNNVRQLNNNVPLLITFSYYNYRMAYLTPRRCLTPLMALYKYSIVITITPYAADIACKSSMYIISCD